MANPHLHVDPITTSFVVDLPHLDATGTFDVFAGSITIDSAVVSPPHHAEIALIDSPITLTGVNITHILDHLI
jgi:hypothetical protein